MEERLIKVDNEMTGSFNWELAKDQTFKKCKVLRNQPYDRFDQLCYSNPDEAQELLETGLRLIDFEG